MISVFDQWELEEVKKAYPQFDGMYRIFSTEGNTYTAGPFYPMIELKTIIK